MGLAGADAWFVGEFTTAGFYTGSMRCGANPSGVCGVVRVSDESNAGRVDYQYLACVRVVNAWYSLRAATTKREKRADSHVLMWRFLDGSGHPLDRDENVNTTVEQNIDTSRWKSD